MHAICRQNEDHALLLESDLTAVFPNSKNTILDAYAAIRELRANPITSQEPTTGFTRELCWILSNTVGTNDGQTYMEICFPNKTASLFNAMKTHHANLL
ncbi:hypothetical protein A6E01_20375 (plasmid) [Vibrio breoganii]|uniref:Uncharacterized protein n=1 Tax=Vibrio breoganii TaxID=553239 RepID=A0AAN1CUB3_9VIBR|nr:hypothetical protein [Vibrio breoganii]ANO35571.1 hypothetical protein A6E01_20375 [Vibrio breoganii]PML15833.1 hypothetical protein BCT84_07470 [Vibrio breoganii]